MAPDGPMQSRHRAGRQLVNRRGIHGGPLNLRRRGTKKQLEEWIFHYRKEVEAGRFCPVRGAKIIARFERAMERCG